MMPSYDEFISEVEAGRVGMFVHPTIPDLVGFNYHEIVSFKRLWNDINLYARGTVFYKKECISIPFTKFFNLEELDADFTLRKVKLVQEKEDGSLIISFVIKDEVLFCTRGSFTSDQAILAKKIWDEYHAPFIDIEWAKKHTMLFELVGPSNRVVCRKHSSDGLVLLSCMKKEDSSEIDESDSDILAAVLNCKRPESYHVDMVRDVYVSVKGNESPNYEGVVVTLDDGSKLKIKSLKYLKLHKELASLEKKSYILDQWESFEISGSLADAFMIPDEFYPELIQKVTDISFEFNVKVSKWNLIYEDVLKKAKSGKPRREMAAEFEDYRWMLSDAYSGVESFPIEKYIKMFRKEKE
jgi:T4 RnlA family RNA ligase